MKNQTVSFIFYGYDAHGRRTQESIFGADNTQTYFRATDWGDPRTNPNLSSAIMQKCR
jgi:hypothetical protein